ncbi:MAG TPA: HmuY family protein [Longimicrobiales bacterium]|nr:HmuY family protein [Longimicrobiales bacterium]
MRRFSILFAAAAALSLPGCDDLDPVEVHPDPSTLTVDASTDWAFVRLGETATQVSVTDPATSEAWDIAFNATRVMLNGGSAGPAGVTGYCVCQNASASDAQVEAMTAAGERPDFEAVTLADVPSDDQAWQSDALDPAISGWYVYDMTTHQVSAAPDRVWQVRGAGEAPEYAKLHVTQISDGTQGGARVTIEYAVQPAAGAPFGAVRTAVLDGRTEPVYFDFATGAATDGPDWDIMLDGYVFRINGGVSGDGGAGAVLADESFAAMTDASDAPAQVYRGDAFGGVFASTPWYRYNLDGNHTVFPTYDVFLIQSGASIYKIQITGYYSTTGDARWITFRYAPLES